MPKVNPDILRWARETAGLSPGEAVAKLRLADARGASAIERLAALEAGEDSPTRAMLVNMAKRYRRPFLTFYLSAPPRRGDRGQDFRTLPEGQSQSDRALLDALIRDVRARQSMVRAVLEDEEEATPLSFVGSMNMSNGVAEVHSSIQDVVRIGLRDFRSQPSPLDAFASLRSGAEKAGVFVLLIGNLGSHHTTIDPETFRGFALADEVAPFVVINDQDSEAAWSFTLLHELAHILLGQTGISGGRAEIEIERFCNDVASEFLLPTPELGQILRDDIGDLRATRHRINEFAAGRNLSRSMVAYRLYRAGAIDKHDWRSLSTFFRDKWIDQRNKRRQRGRAQEGGPNYYVVRRHRLGSALIGLVGRMTSSGALSTSKAGKVLGVKAKNVQAILEMRKQVSAR